MKLSIYSLIMWGWGHRCHRQQWEVVTWLKLCPCMYVCTVCWFLLHRQASDIDKWGSATVYCFLMVLVFLLRCTQIVIGATGTLRGYFCLSSLLRLSFQRLFRFMGFLFLSGCSTNERSPNRHTEGRLDCCDLWLRMYMSLSRMFESVRVIICSV